MESDLDTETLTVRRVGRILRKMRWRSERSNRAKGWVVNLPQLQRWTQAYGIEWPQEPITAVGAPHPTNGTNGTNGITAPEADDARHGSSGELPSPDGDSEVFWI